MMSRVTPHHVDQSFYAVCDVGTARPVSITLDKAITQGPIYDLAQGPACHHCTLLISFTEI